MKEAVAAERSDAVVNAAVCVVCSSPAHSLLRKPQQNRLQPWEVKRVGMEEGAAPLWSRLCDGLWRRLRARAKWSRLLLGDERKG